MSNDTTELERLRVERDAALAELERVKGERDKGDHPTEGDIERMALREERNTLRAENERLKELTKDRMDDWKRIQDAERERDAALAELENYKRCEFDWEQTRRELHRITADNSALRAENERLRGALVTIECGLVTTEETAQYADLRPKEIARKALE